MTNPPGRADRVADGCVPVASHEQPRRVDIIDQLPINPMGKVLENELRAPYWQGRARNV